MLPLIAGVREAVDVDVAALPVPYPTTEEEPSFQSLTDPNCNYLPGDGRPFPTALDPSYSNRYEIAQFAREAYELGVRYFGACCGAAPHFIRSMAEALGRHTPASAYSPDMSKHAFLGSDAQLHPQPGVRSRALMAGVSPSAGAVSRTRESRPPVPCREPP
jgi:betaine-homocysteine S-methyltransferase